MKRTKKLTDEFPITQDQLDTLKEVIKTYGMDSQMNIATEEMSELIKALSKVRRNWDTPGGYFNTVTSAVEEIADVQIMLLQLAIIFGDGGEILSAVDLKINRMKKRLKNREGENKNRNNKGTEEQ